MWIYVTSFFLLLLEVVDKCQMNSKWVTKHHLSTMPEETIKYKIKFIWYIHWQTYLSNNICLVDLLSFFCPLGWSFSHFLFFTSFSLTVVFFVVVASVVMFAIQNWTSSISYPQFIVDMWHQQHQAAYQVMCSSRERRYHPGIQTMFCWLLPTPGLRAP